MSTISFNKTIRGRLLLLAISVEVLMLSVMVLNSLRLLHGAMTDQARTLAAQYHPVLEAALTAPLAQRDYATVQAIVTESRSAGGVDYIVVLDRTGKAAGSSGWQEGAQLPEPSSKFPFFNLGKTHRYDVAIPLSRLNQPLGTLHFGINLSQIIAAQKSLLTQGLSIAAIEIILSSLVIALIGYWLTRHMSALTHASRQVAAGNLSPPPLPEGDDDVGQLGVAFNTMSRAIAERVRELTASKEAAESSERAASTSEERLKLALSGADLGLWDWNIIAGEVEFSHEWADMLGYSVGELEPYVKTWEQIVHPDDMEYVQTALEQHLNGASPMYEAEYRCLSKSGEWRWILDRGRVVAWTSDGMPSRAAGTHLDITDRKRAQDALKALNDELELRVQEEVRKNREKDSLLLQQDKLVSIGQLAAGVAHEINNPMGFILSNLNTLRGYVDNVKRYTTHLQEIIATDCPPEKRQLADGISKQLDIPYILEDLASLIDESSEGADRVKRIVLDLKDFARTDEKGYKAVDLNNCIKSTLNMVKNEIKYVAEVVLNLGELPPVVCSANQINQVIANLLINAGNAIDKQGTITVVTRQESGQVVLEVCDTGHGMTEEVRKRIFEPFFTTKEVGKGTGLGLTISYDIISKHGGEISVTSAPGTGTTFTVRLPVICRQESPEVAAG